MNAWNTRLSRMPGASGFSSMNSHITSHRVWSKPLKSSQEAGGGGSSHGGCSPVSRSKMRPRTKQASGKLLLSSHSSASQ